MSKKVVRKFSAFAIILVVMLASLCIFTLYQSSVNAVILDALDDIDIDTAQISSSLDQVDVAEAADNLGTAEITNLSYGNWQSISSGSWSVGGHLNIFDSGHHDWEDKYYYIILKISDSSNTIPNLLYCLQNNQISVQFRMQITNRVDSGETFSFGIEVNSDSNYNDFTGSGNTETWMESKEGYLSDTQVTLYGHISLCNGLYDDGQVSNLQVKFNKKDTTAPSISVSGLNTSNYTASTAFTVSDSGSKLYNVSFNYTSFTGLTDSWSASGENSSSKKCTLNKGFGTYVISVKDNIGNSASKTIYYYSATIIFDAGSYGSISGISNLSGNTYGNSYTISATVTPNAGYYFTGWTRSGDGGTSNIGVGTYSNGKWTSSSLAVSKPDASNCSGQITWTAQYAPISALYTATGSAMTYNGSAQTNLNVNSTAQDNTGSNVLSVSCIYNGTTKAGTSYSSSDAPKYAGTYYGVVTVTNTKDDGGGVLGSDDSKEYSFTINPRSLSLTPSFTGTFSKTYDGTAVLNNLTCSEWTFDENSSPQIDDGLNTATTIGNSGFSFKISDANVGTQTIQICGSGGVTLGKNSPLSAYVTLSTTVTSNADDIIASYSLVFSGTTANYEITKKELTVIVSYDGTVTGYVGEASYNDVPGKVYDGTTEAKLNITLDGLVNNESFSVGEAEKGETVYLTYEPYSFADAIPNSYTILVEGFVLHDGNGKASNYKLKDADTEDGCTASCTAVILARTVKLAIDGVTSKVYDGTDVAYPTVVFAEGFEPLSADNITIAAGTASYSQAGDSQTDVGTGLTVTLSGYSISGTLAGNYYLDKGTVTSDSGEITACPLTVTFTYGGKVYDGTTDVNTKYFTFHYDGLITGDKVTASCTAAFDNANAGSRNVTSDDIAIKGDDVGNYNLTSTSYTLNAEISQRSVKDNDDIVLILDTEGIPSHTYDGTQYTPAPDVIDTAIGENGTTLVFDNDYTRGYSSLDRINAGTYYYIITGKGNYTGSKSFEFEITKSALSLTANDISLVYGQIFYTSAITGTAVNPNNPSLVVDGTWSLESEIEYNIELAKNGKGNIPLVDATGTVTVKFTTENTDTNPFNKNNYVADATTEITLTVTPREISIVAKPQTSVYGTDPKFDETAYTSTVTLAEGEILTFSPVTDDATLSTGLACEVKYDSNVGTYEITSAFSSDNYTISYTSADFTVTKLGVTVVPDSGQDKYFGEADPAYYTYTATPTQTLAAEFKIELAGELTRVQGETVGTYYYSLGTITNEANANYTVALNNTRSFAVLARPISVTASSYEIYFGEPLPALGYTVTDGLGEAVTVVSDESGNVTITVGTQTVVFDIYVIRTATGSSAATNAVTVASYDTYAVLGSNPNFTVTATRGTFDILRRPVTVTPTPNQSKYYGDSDPSAFAYTVSLTEGFTGLTGDAIVANYALTGALTRYEGEDVGTYAIYQDTVTDENNPNYAITFVDGVTFAVARRDVVIYPSAVYIDFGDDLPKDESLTYTATGLVGDETLVGGLKFEAEVYTLDQAGNLAVGAYDIVADSKLNNENNPNYNITAIYGADTFNVLPLTAYIEADGNSIVFGTEFGTETYTLDFTAHDRKGNPIDNDIFDGALALRDNVSGILPVGNYDIVLGTLVCANYVVTLSGNPQLSVTPKTVTVTSGDVSQVYGENRIAPTFPDPTEELVAGYPLDAQSALGVSYPDREAVGKYAITLGNLENLNLNYDFKFDKEYFYYIVARHIVIVPDEGMTSVYGNTEVNITYTSYFYDEPEKAGLIGSDTLGGKLSRENSTQKGVGSYAIILGTLNNASVSGYNANYTVELSGETVYYTITPRPVTVTANTQSQVFGEAERVLTVTYSAGSLLSGDTITGSPERVSGVIPGVYAISQGTISNENGDNPNYAITFVGSTYTITKRPVTFYAADASKGYGEDDPDSFAYYAFGGTGTSGNAFVAGYEPTVVITRAEGEYPASYAYSYSATGANADYYVFTFRYDTQFTITRGQAVVNVIDAKYENGIFVIERDYRGEAYTLETELTMGTGLTTTIRINNVATDKYTDVGEYTALVSVTGDAYFAGTTATVRITVKPYDLGELSPSRALDSTSVMKTYGDEDPSFATSVSGLNGAKISVTFTRVAGENADSYLFDSVTVHDKNYTASIAADNYFTVEARKIEIVPETFQKIYGALDPELTQTVTSDVGESFEVTFSREEDGDNAGSYDITAVTLEEGFADNYSAVLTDAEDKFVIVPKAATVTANALSRVFDATDGTDGGVTFTYTASGFLYDDADALVGALGIAGYDSALPVEAGTYEIAATVAFAHANYKVTFVGAEYVIERAPVTVISNSVSYEYGVEIKPFTYTVVGTVYEGYPLAGELGLLDSFNVGEHSIPQGTLTDENNPNYDITYIPGICKITVITVTVTPVALTEQVYGDAPTFIAYTIEGNVVTEDVGENGMFIRGALACYGVSAGEYAVEIGTLSEENPDYVIKFEPAGAIYRITPKTLTITADEVSVYYGDEEAELTYSVDGLVEGDFLVGALSRVPGSSVGEYPINIGDLNAQNAGDYKVKFVSANYVIMPRPLTVQISDQSSEYSETGEYAFDGNAYKITEGTVVEGDNVGITIAKEAGTAMGLYAITGAYTNKNYKVTFVDGVYEIRKYSSVISYTASVSFIYDGTAYVIDATCSSGAPVLVTYELNGEISHVNSFSEVGKYVITLSAEETDTHYAPASAAVEITILRDVLLAEEGGIDIRVDNEEGFEPDVSVEMEKLPQNDPGINSVISSSESVVRAYNVQMVDGNGEITSSVNNPSISVKVPSALRENDVVKVIVKENGNYSVRLLEVKEGYVTIDNAADVTTIAFISEADNDYLIYIIIGVAALIIILSTIVFLFRKRI